MQYKTEGRLIRPFILLFLSQNFLYKTNMKFYAVWQSRMVEMHIRIMKTRLCIFTQSDESCFQFRLFFGIPEEVFAASSCNRRNQGLRSQFFFNYFSDDVCDFWSNDGSWCMVKNILNGFCTKEYRITRYIPDR